MPPTPQEARGGRHVSRGKPTTQKKQFLMQVFSFWVVVSWGSFDLFFGPLGPPFGAHVDAFWAHVCTRWAPFGPLLGLHLGFASSKKRADKVSKAGGVRKFDMTGKVSTAGRAGTIGGASRA